MKLYKLLWYIPVIGLFILLFSKKYFPDQSSIHYFLTLFFHTYVYAMVIGYIFS